MVFISNCIQLLFFVYTVSSRESELYKFISIYSIFRNLITNKFLPTTEFYSKLDFILFTQVNQLSLAIGSLLVL